MFDTRAKILSPSDFAVYAEAHPESPIVAGTFDPMWAPHAARLKEIAGSGKLLAVVEPKPDGLLNDRARAEVVASFGVVDRVTIATRASIERKAVVDERERDQQRYDALADRVRKRNHV